MTPLAGGRLRSRANAPDREEALVDGIIDALTEQNAELAALLTDRSEDEAHLPSACAGWTVSDVVLHLAQTNEIAQASVEDRFSEAAGRVRPVRRTRDVSNVDEWRGLERGRGAGPALGEGARALAAVGREPAGRVPRRGSECTRAVGRR